MIIRRKSPITGEINEMDLPITQDQIDAYESGAMIQTAFPNLNPSQREFFKTGMTDADWETVFPEECQ